MSKTFVQFFLAALTMVSSCFSAVVTDDVGDVFGVGSVQIDISFYAALTDSGGTTFTVNFTGPVVPGSAGMPHSLSGFIDIDVDQDPATGVLPRTSIFSPPPQVVLGADVYVDVGSELAHAGLVDVFSSTDQLLYTLPITFGASSISLCVQMKAPSGTVNYARIFGTQLEPTDRAPNGSVATESTATPEPSSVFPILLVIVLTYAFQKRRLKISGVLPAAGEDGFITR